VDAQIGRLMEWLDENGEAKRTLVIAISDHGEGLGDHGEDEHQLFVYDSTLHVPLLLRWPGQLPAGSRIEGQFRGVDLLPTVLDLVGSTPPETSGVSHASVLRAGGVIPDNELYAESLYGQIHFGWAPLRVLRAKGWKYTEAPRAELYELREDPGETRNRVGDSERTAEGLRELLFRYDMSDPTAASVSVDPAATEKLAALGYIGGAFFTDEPSGVDPKDMMSEYRAFRRGTVRALELIEAGDHAGAVRLLQPLAEPRIGPDGRLTEFVSFTVSFYLGRALLELGRFEEAIEPLQAALRLSPSTASLYVSLARAQAGAGRFQDAAATATLGLQAAPGHAALMHLRGRLYLNDGATGPAETALREAREAAPDHVLVHVDLAHLLRTTGREQEALAEAEEALRLDPRAVPAQLARGLCLAALGRSDEAEAAFREALELSPADPDALFFVATIALRSGRFAEAVDRLESLVRVAPGHPQARQMLAQARARSGGTRKAETTVHLRILRVADRQAAERIQERVRSGEEFAALARAESQDASASVGGDLGGVRISDLAEPLRTAAAHLAPGDVSPLLSTSNGFVLLQRQR
jgi:tetratricopeptide (TPR) repeat protein